jgi:hypothetical protein
MQTNLIDPPSPAVATAANAAQSRGRQHDHVRPGGTVGLD